MITTQKDYYDPPKMGVFDIPVTSILCSSPGAGENEEIGFEDWLNGGTINLF